MSERKKSRYEGLALAATFWLWGSIAWFAPVYIGIDGWGKWALNVLGAGFVAIAFMGAAIEVGKLWRNEAFGYWGVGLLFLVPAGLLRALAEFVTLPSPGTGIVKGLALFLDAFGGTFFLMGIPYFSWEPASQEQTAELSPEEEVEEKVERRRTRGEIAGSAGLLLLTVISAILKVVFGIG